MEVMVFEDADIDEVVVNELVDLVLETVVSRLDLDDITSGYCVGYVTLYEVSVLATVRYLEVTTVADTLTFVKL